MSKRIANSIFSTWGGRRNGTQSRECSIATPVRAIRKRTSLISRMSFRNQFDELNGLLRVRPMTLVIIGRSSNESKRL